MVRSLLIFFLLGLALPAHALALEWAQSGITIDHAGQTYTTTGSEMVKRTSELNNIGQIFDIEQFWAPSGLVAVRVRWNGGPWNPCDTCGGIIPGSRWAIINKPSLEPDGYVDRCSTTTADGELWKVRTNGSDEPCATAKRALTRYMRRNARPAGWSCRSRSHRARCWRSRDSDNFGVAIETSEEELQAQDYYRAHQVSVCGTVNPSAGKVIVTRESLCDIFNEPAIMVSVSRFIYGVPTIMSYAGWTCTQLSERIVCDRGSGDCALISTATYTHTYWDHALDERGWFHWSPYADSICR